MRAMRFSEAGHAEIIEMPNPVPKAGEVVVKVKAAGICASDIAAFQGKHDVRRPPLIGGHETAGEIVAVGPSVQGRVVGERVGVEPYATCGVCPFCRRGDSEQCLDRRSLGVGEWTGAFAEYVVVSERICHVLPAGMSWEEAAALEPFCVGLHAVRRASLRAGETVAIVGAGAIGLMTLLATRCCAPRWVCTMDPCSLKREVSLRCGADLALDPDVDDPVEKVLAATDGLGADVVFVAVASDSALRQAAQMCRRMGRLVIIASFFTGALELRQIVARERMVIGSFGSTVDEFALAIRLWERGNLPHLSSLLTERIRLTDAPSVVAAMARGEKTDSIKITIAFD